MSDRANCTRADPGEPGPNTADIEGQLAEAVELRSKLKSMSDSLGILSKAIRDNRLIADASGALIEQRRRRAPRAIKCPSESEIVDTLRSYERVAPLLDTVEAELRRQQEEQNQIIITTTRSH